MKRRDFIRTMGVLTVFGVTTIGIRQKALAANAKTTAGPHVHGAVDTTPATVEDDFRYRGRRVRVLRRAHRATGRSARATVDSSTLTLSIDGREQAHHVFAQIGNGYGSHMFPYQTYRRPRDLARRLIDQDGILFSL